MSVSSFNGESSGFIGVLSCSVDCSAKATGRPSSPSAVHVRVHHEWTEYEARAYIRGRLNPMVYLICVKTQIIVSSCAASGPGTVSVMGCCFPHIPELPTSMVLHPRKLSIDVWGVGFSSRKTRPRRTPIACRRWSPHFLLLGRPFCDIPIKTRALMLQKHRDKTAARTRDKEMKTILTFSLRGNSLSQPAASGRGTRRQKGLGSLSTRPLSLFGSFP